MGAEFLRAGFETCFAPQHLSALGSDSKHISNPDFGAILIYNLWLTGPELRVKLGLAVFSLPPEARGSARSSVADLATQHREFGGFACQNACGDQSHPTPPICKEAAVSRICRLHKQSVGACGNNLAPEHYSQGGSQRKCKGILALTGAVQQGTRRTACARSTRVPSTRRGPSRC